MAHSTYATINVSDLGNVDFSEVGQTGENTVRKNLAEDLFLLKWNTTPSFITNSTIIPVQTLTHSEAVVLMSTTDWEETT